MLLATLLTGSLFVLPIWNITLEAPQYPDPIGMNIYINKFTGAGENDIQNINIMNHYVGMKEIPEVIPEFTIFPYVIGGMIILGFLFSLIGKRNLYLLWFILMLGFCSVAMYDFYMWEYDYGHNLKENAAIKFTDEKGDPMTYQPPLIGAKTILNFRAISMPRIGAYLLALSMGLSIFAFTNEKKELISKGSVVPSMLILLAFFLASCSAAPRDINYGMDQCSFCKMTIVDNQHAAQLVTEKGRNYNYDAIECMINDLESWDKPDIEFFLVTDYANPGKLFNAEKASYLISNNIPSPMGAFLSAFEDQNEIEKTKENAGGEVFTWVEVKEKLKN